jgi:hypothetical protein
VALAYFWARAVAAADASAHTGDFRAAKRATATFHYARLLPRAQAHAAAIRSGAATLTAITDAQFG